MEQVTSKHVKEWGSCGYRWAQAASGDRKSVV